MSRRRSLAALIGQHFAPFRGSRRTALTALVFGLLIGRRLGLAAIPRRMAGPGSVRHKSLLRRSSFGYEGRIKQVGRFAHNTGVQAFRATVRLVEWVLSLCRRGRMVWIDSSLSPGRTPHETGDESAPLPIDSLAPRV